ISTPTPTTLSSTLSLHALFRSARRRTSQLLQPGRGACVGFRERQRVPRDGSSHRASRISRARRRSSPSSVGYRLGRSRNLCPLRSEEHTSELQSRSDLVCRLLL